MEAIMNLGSRLSIVTAAFGQFLPSKLPDAMDFGEIMFTPPFLPKHRGGAPIHLCLFDLAVMVEWEAINMENGQGNGWWDMTLPSQYSLLMRTMLELFEN